MPPVHYSTLDIDLAAYLMLRGAALHGVYRHNKAVCNFVFTHKSVLNFVIEYKRYKRIRFAPKEFIDMRFQLKKAASKLMHE
ncbi:hypothetical protein C5Y93_04920 [Blastopirellula marina]|uniref:Uncharacterized protein n=1 Tax=Blastopirellula marina TaxID=124 RepID=A0A2S8GSI3_9BACT|nr:hypothetical protein C5Y93_04920 [Blastopirellula marina]